MQIRVDHKGLVEKCQEFKTKNIPVKWAIIDDMWAHVTDFYGREYDTFLDMVGIMHASAMHDFEPAPIRFPEGLASVGAHFDNNMINCMGMSSEDMFNRRMSPISRCSDDFKPVTVTVSPADVDGVEGEKFVIYEHFSKEFAIVDYNGGIYITLNNQDEYKLYVIVPYVDGFAPIV